MFISRRGVTSIPFSWLLRCLTVAVCFAPVARAAGPDEWFDFNPAKDSFTAQSAIDLRSLNETYAGEHGPIRVKGDQFILGTTGKPVRFWGVDGPSGAQVKTFEDAQRLARDMAKHGINLIRLQGSDFDKKTGDVHEESIAQLSVMIDAMREQGIYTHISFYFPVGFNPQAGLDYLPGYNGKQPPFAALYFNPQFQERYRQWVKAVLDYKSPRTGRRIADEPAVMVYEIVNEDGLFFWTFSEKNIPDPEMRILETQFAQWLTKKYGSLEKASSAWNGQKLPHDNFEDNLVAFRPLWNIFNERTPRDQDTVRFLAEVQRAFYADTEKYVRSLGYKGLVLASNWTTADPKYLTPIDKWTYTADDFIDRHGYFECSVKGQFSAWSLRDGYTYRDRSALRFEPEQLGKPDEFSHPVNDPHWGGKPSMMSETAFNRPNRYRTEAPLLYATYGALQDSNSIIHFAYDGLTWDVKPNYFMQPWTLMTPTQLGQFPATALIYRKGLITPGDTVVDLQVSVNDILDLKGVALAQKAALDSFRQADVGSSATAKADGTIDPLVYYVGQTKINFVEGSPGKSTVKDISKFIDRDAKTITSTNHQVKLDWGRGLLTLDAPGVQAVCGDLSVGEVALSGMRVKSDLNLGQVIAVPLDDKPLAQSSRILLQVMSEERASGFRSQEIGNGMRRILSIGHNPWQVRQLTGTVSLLRNDAATMSVTALDDNGYATKKIGNAGEITLLPDVIYYLISK